MTHDPQELRRRAEVLAREADTTENDYLASLLYLRSSRMILEAGTFDQALATGTLSPSEPEVDAIRATLEGKTVVTTAPTRAQAEDVFRRATELLS